MLSRPAPVLATHLHWGQAVLESSLKSLPHEGGRDQRPAMKRAHESSTRKETTKGGYPYTIEIKLVRTGEKESWRESTEVQTGLR